MKKMLFLFIAVLAFASCQKNEPITLNVMSFNVRYDNPKDSLNNWQYRKDVSAQSITENAIDIVGTQEVLHRQLKDLEERLPEYKSIGVGREDGKTEGEYSAILYKKERFNEISSGYFWLSKTPDIAGSKGWDGACERIATWAILEDIKSKKQVFFINTHLDHEGEVARREGVNLLLSKTKELSKGIPVIVTGDFNATPESDVIKNVIDSTKPYYLLNSKDIAIEKKGPEWTFHLFGKLPLESRIFIDYIFVSQDIKVSKFEVLPEKKDDIFISDHSLIMAEIAIP